MDVTEETLHGAREHAKFTAMTEGTAEDWAIIGKEYRTFAKGVADRVLDHLKLLEGDFGGFPVCRLEHSLQTATRAHRDGRDERYVVMALMHDIGDTLGTFNHPDVAAAIIKPFVSEEAHWICEKHGAFQGYYYFHHVGMDRDVREQWRGHPYFEACAHFCEKYDQAAFDPNYDSAPLSFFEPMVRRVMEKPINSMYAKVIDD
ncbi:HD domain-containing protein [Altererythrobacter xiamenensis]|uniref:HD domain-containing protein n=1 Tax=Altererythrobacter xiamenensis TaxID=1316679 RepID=A0A1Y6F5S7_9SPHN|nr:HD domain-containing protein [Altererythrobacter xiamenensis]SMQ68911.1 HD domain-containing protein [Altererythrobacter xiamenensis]